ncbi:hypothetical protein [Pseudomonas fluorescens]|uniref:Uncharacterized protein n=1 Tax=Pseudomonas fluorescens TaxID=294 RepID=A0A5E7U1J6_PSEFL|nr:hypothetical protein [Pseudomonas fluorescens]VVQ05157.1 hypothetical protein PS928_02974 [Pseudomonas fluorescens]
MNIFKEALLLSVESTRVWRASNALKYPDDARNLNCANALGNVAETILALPDDHELFTKLATVNEPGCECWSEQESRILSRWGFYGDAAPADFDPEFVTHLIECIDRTLASRAYSNLNDDFANNIRDQLHGDFIAGFIGHLWSCFDGKLTEDFIDELISEFAEEVVSRLADELTEEYEEKPVDDMDKIVGECLSQYADKINGEWAEDFIQTVPHKLFD